MPKGCGQPAQVSKACHEQGHRSGIANLHSSTPPSGIPTSLLGAMQASQTQQRISAELTATQAAVGQASRQAAAWAALIDGTDKALRDLGDCQTYFEVIEAELKELADCLEQTAAQQPQQLEAATAAAGPQHEPRETQASKPPVALPASSQDPAKM